MKTSKRGPGRPPKKKSSGHSNVEIGHITPEEASAYSEIWTHPGPKRKRGRPRKDAPKTVQFTGTYKFQGPQVSNIVAPETIEQEKPPTSSSLLTNDYEFSKSSIPIVKIEFVSSDAARGWYKFTEVGRELSLRKQLAVGFLLHKDKTTTKISQSITSLSDIGSGTYTFQVIPTVAITKLEVLGIVSENDIL